MRDKIVNSILKYISKDETKGVKWQKKKYLWIPRFLPVS